MTRNLAETVMGGVVLIVAAIFIYLFVTATQIQTVDGYEVNANFAKVGGLQRGSDVRMSGINVGTVAARRLDAENYEAVVTMTIRAGIKLPDDTVATIANDGLLGGKYVRLKPGRSKKFVAPDGKLEKTEDFKSIEDQVGEIIFLAGGSLGGGAGPR